MANFLHIREELIMATSSESKLGKEKILEYIENKLGLNDERN